MARYPQQSFDAMRQDAIRRSKEMQRRAMPPLPPESFSSMPPKPKPKSDLLEHLHLSEDLKKMLTDWDGEKLALLALLYLLYKEGAELELLIAIAYIML
ncbi:MAG: hypothetical protein K2K06_12125 [Oscillospiraceae bacterium]|nr:hypothetical protein [Ruminococcus sp.]MDE6708766.1 hypothetical protein [Oscillospiraceae bacterium]